MSSLAVEGDVDDLNSERASDRTRVSRSRTGMCHHAGVQLLDCTQTVEML
jgi:hypothetical protein